MLQNSGSYATYRSGWPWRILTLAIPVQEARRMVAQGEAGEIRRIDVAYRQGWLSKPMSEGQRQASWRCGLAQSGPGGFGDIGTHAAHLAALFPVST